MAIMPPRRDSARMDGLWDAHRAHGRGGAQIVGDESSSGPASLGLRESIGYAPTARTASGSVIRTVWVDTPLGCVPTSRNARLSSLRLYFAPVIEPPTCATAVPSTEKKNLPPVV